MFSLMFKYTNLSRDKKAHKYHGLSGKLSCLVMIVLIVTVVDIFLPYEVSRLR